MGEKRNESNEWLEEEKGPEKPLGLRLIALVLVINGIQYSISGSIYLGDFMAPYYPIGSALLLVLGVAFVIVGKGLANWRRWALFGTVVLNIIAGSIAAMLLLGGIYAPDYSIILGIMINLIIVVYLLRPNVRAQFEQYGYSSPQ